MSEPWTSQPGQTPAKIPNHLTLAIVACVVSLIACCLPHGVVSLIFALQVDKKAATGDIEGANRAAKQAKTFAWVSIILAIVGFVIAMIFGIFGAVISVIANA